MSEPVADDIRFIEPRQIVVVHAAVWEALEEWGRKRGLVLHVLFPATKDDIASYMFGPA